MEKTSFKHYRFDRFKLDSRSCSLYFDDQVIEKINKKSLQVLIVLLEKQKQVVSHEEIVEKVWGEDVFGVMPNNVAQYILKLRKILAQNQPDKTFIGTGNKRGYIFEEDVVVENELVEASELKEPDAEHVEERSFSPLITPETHYSPPEDNSRIKKNTRLKLMTVLLGLIPLVILLVLYFSTNEEDKVRRVVKDSQMFESLVLYQNPTSFDENQLKEYWIDEAHNSNLDIAKIRKGLKNLVEKGIHYGRESKCENFDFVSVDVNESENFAVAKTIEAWFVAKYRSDGTFLENRTIGPYVVTYNLRKFNGKWLIEKSSTARASR